MSAITKLQAREILDSRGNPTIEVDITLAGQHSARASVPSGASTGSKEAIELRDGGVRFMGKGVLQAVHNVNKTISQAVLNKSFAQESLDAMLNSLDGTDNKGNLGANAVLAVSLAFAKASAVMAGIPLYQHLQWGKMALPTPFVNILNGGQHADNELAIQEFMIVPFGIVGMGDKIRAVAEVFHHLKSILKKAGLNTNVGDEGGFAPQISNSRQAIELVMRAIEVAGYGFDQIQLAIDAAASEFYRDGLYHLDGLALSSEKMVEYYGALVKDYPLVSLEDPLAEDDWHGWKMITALLPDTQIIGDDIFVTNSDILKRGITEKVANSILIKPNQIGTLSETIATMKMAAENGYRAVVSHRSGETEDALIAHLAVASGCGQIKTGSMCRTDRVAKYNELLRIAEGFGF